jgi:hypothetical protein
MDNTERRKTMMRTPFEARIMMYIFRAAAVAGSREK